MAASRAITLESNLIKMTVLRGNDKVGTACAVTLAGYPNSTTRENVNTFPESATERE